MTFQENQFFRKFRFTNDQLRKYYRAAEQDRQIAQTSEHPEIIFRFSYDSLVKLAVYVTAASGLKVRSIPGHHIKLIEKLSEICGVDDALLIADEMRRKRNLDLYEGGVLITEMEARSYMQFVHSVFNGVTAKLPRR